MAKARTTGGARREKTVLARQEVSRLPSRHDRGNGPQEGVARDIAAVFAFLGAIGLFCALWTYHREDAGAPKVLNLVGPVGHRMASALFGTFGFCGYLVPAAILYSSLALFVRGRGKRRWAQIAALVCLAFSGSVLGHLLMGDRPSLSYPPGGAIGAALGETLRSLFSTFGAVLLMCAAACGALIVATNAAFARLCVAIGRAVGSGAAFLADFAVEESRRRVAAFKEARAQRLAEEREEDAVFAQQLADAEERENLAESPPSEAEQDAFEAEAVAEEAARLAKEAEDRRAREEGEAEARTAALKAAKRARKNQEDPAWATPPDPAAVQAPAEEQPADEAFEKSRPPSVISVENAADPGAATAKPVETASARPVVPTVAGTPEPLPGPITAVPTLPVIIEPVAPPKPSARSRDEKKDPFAFEGGTSFSLPPLSLLEMEEQKRRVLDKDVFFATAEKLREKLASFGIEGAVKEIRPGPVVTMYEFEPGPGIKISKIASLADDLAMAMEALKVRIVAPIPGKGVVGIEVPNKERESVFLREIVEQDIFQKSASRLTMAIGKNIEGMPYVADLARMPHLLIAGTTGSGKSVSVNAMIMSLLLKATPEEVRFIMVDPKVTELSIYEGIPHLLLPVVTDPHKAALALRWAVEEMERRYLLLAAAGVKNIAGYNKWVDRAPDAPPEPKPVEKTTSSGRKLRIIDVAEGESEEDALARATGEPSLGVPEPRDDDPPEPAVVVEVDKAEERAAEDEARAFEAAQEASKPKDKEPPRKLPFVVVIIDEVADLMMVASREVETYVTRLAGKARASGIHLMMATQRPSTDVITGVIKANFPARISFQLRSKPDSMTIVGTVGAEALLGMGDMLVLPPTSSNLERVHGAYVSDQEINRVVAHLKAQGKPVYDESILKPRDGDGEAEAGEEEVSDEAYDQCLALVGTMQQVSVSMLQRKLRLGYNRAARIIERMEREGVVGPANGSKPRDVLIRPAGESYKEVNL